MIVKRDGLSDGCEKSSNTMTCGGVGERGNKEVVLKKSDAKRR